MDSVNYIIHSGKNFKLQYYIKNYARLLLPKSPFIGLLEKTLAQVESRSDRAYIYKRVDYYNKLSDVPYNENWEKKLSPLKDQAMCRQKVYYFDTFQYTRWFPQNLKWNLCPGDVTFIPDVPSIVKSRPINSSNHYSVLLNLNKIRHFIFVNDHIPFVDKKDKVIFRGKIGQPNTSSFKEKRYRFLKNFYNHPLCDLGEVKSSNMNPQWLVDKMTIREHLDYKFILALEGNDVASNLKWIMSSNSLAVMPRPEYETWFMEGSLIPNVHYVEIKRDYSDLEEKINYYIEHPDEAQKIIDSAHKYVSQFKDKKREMLISLLVLKRYFEATNR